MRSPKRSRSASIKPSGMGLRWLCSGSMAFTLKFLLLLAHDSTAAHHPPFARRGDRGGDAILTVLRGAADQGICWLRRTLPADAHRLGQSLEYAHGIFPVDAAIGDALAVRKFLTRNQILTARHEVALHHDAEDAVIARLYLPRDVVDDERLLAVVLGAVRVTGVHHKPRQRTGLGDHLCGGLHTLGVVIGFLPAAQNHVAIFVAHGRNDSGMTALGNGK